jgi:imidazolonepropionase-like amidohydrolase
MKSILKLTCAAALGAIALSQSAMADHHTTDKAIKCGALADATMSRARGASVIVVRGGEIAEIRSGDTAPDGMEIVDLSGKTCLPGLTDLHTHLMIVDPISNTYSDGMSMSSADYTLRGLKNAQIMLENGFTTLRVPSDGDHQFGVVSLKQAFASGLFQGPRMFVAPHMLSPLGGHSDVQGIAADRHAKIPSNSVGAGEDNVRQAVRRQIKFGADWIKIAASGGIMSLSDDPRIQGFTDAEIAAFADETHRHGKKITAHVHGDAAAHSAAKSKFDSIEHGTLISRRTIQELKKNDVVLVPTAYVMDVLIRECDAGNFPEENCSKVRGIVPQHADNIRSAYRAGVKIGFGTDQIFPHGESLREFKSLVDRGLSPKDAIASATTIAAELLGTADKSGTLKAGNWADIIAVEGNPFDDITVMEKVSFVMKEGHVVRHDR